MPLYKFGVGDVFHNHVKAHPSSSFFIYDSKIYLNYSAGEVGSFVSNAPNVPTGHVNLFELNVDRTAATDTTLVIGHSSSLTDETGSNVPDTGLIYPFVYKGTQKTAFKNIKRDDFINDYADGDVITGSYQLSASIVRQLFNASHDFNGVHPTGSALKNSLDYAKRLGEHYSFPSDASVETNLIKIPSIFYGSEIKKGSVELKFYVTGTLVGHLKDYRRDGALIQYSSTEASAYNDLPAGIVLYKEGFIILTASWTLASTFDPGNELHDKDIDGTSVDSVGKWTRFAMGANDKVSFGSSNTNGSASFSIDFAGTHRVPTITMLAHANRGELNYSNNPTYIEYGQAPVLTSTAYDPITASHFYGEQELTIKNIHSSSYSDPSGSLKKTTYITKVGIYDDKKKLIGIASVAKPVKKTEERDLTFKLKLDI